MPEMRIKSDGLGWGGERKEEGGGGGDVVSAMHVCGRMGQAPSSAPPLLGLSVTTLALPYIQVSVFLYRTSVDFAV